MNAKHFLQVLIVSLGVATSALAVPVGGQGTWETTLKGRDINGNEIAAGSPDAVFFYDTTLDITWLRDASMNGSKNWATQVAWAQNLTVGIFGGWRLPSMVDTGQTGCNFSYGGSTDCGYNVDTDNSEMAHLYYVTLGNLGLCPAGVNAFCDVNPPPGLGFPQPGWGLSNSGYFEGLLPGGYHFGTISNRRSDYAWRFFFRDGLQLELTQNAGLNAMAVRDGDVLVRDIPEPTTVALILAALMAQKLIGANRRKGRLPG